MSLINQYGVVFKIILNFLAQKKYENFLLLTALVQSLLTMIEDVLAGIYILIAVFTLAGNSLTIAAIYQNPKLDTASNQFIYGLAIADLLVISVILFLILISYMFCILRRTSNQQPQ